MAGLHYQRPFKAKCPEAETVLKGCAAHRSKPEPSNAETPRSQGLRLPKRRFPGALSLGRKPRSECLA
jgi:hypothetical protein